MPFEGYTFYLNNNESLFLLRLLRCIKFEEDNISIFNDIISALLSVFSSSLQTENTRENELLF